MLRNFSSFIYEVFESKKQKNRYTSLSNEHIVSALRMATIVWHSLHMI